LLALPGAVLPWALVPAFLRVFSKRAHLALPLTTCPACGSELVIERRIARFQPTYVGRVSLDLHAVAPLENDDDVASSDSAGDLPTV
jgi:hypothetical protein